MAKRVSALAATWQAGHYGPAEHTGVVISQLPDLCLWQVAAWPESVPAVEKALTQALALGKAPKPNQCVVNKHGQGVLRIEPLKWWLIGTEPPALSAEHAVLLDQSHSRTVLLIEGDRAAVLLNRFLPIDFRPSVFPVGSAASSAFHHVGVTVIRRTNGFELYLPRGFAASLWQLLFDSAKQFGVSVTP